MARKQENPLRLEDFTTFCEEVAQAYDRLPMWEQSEVWRWEVLRDSIMRMFPQVQSRVRVDFVPGQPYEAADEMREKVNRTGVLQISTDFNEHPFFTPEENLKFRAVHDYIVHIIPGEGGPDFSRRGELRAYDLHRKLAPVDSWPALFTEVAAQACYANARGEFPPQKLAVLHDFDFYNVGWQRAEDARAANPARKLKNRLMR